MGVFEDQMTQMGYGDEMLNALKILSSDKSKQILQAVAMSKSQPQSFDMSETNLSMPEPAVGTDEVISLASNMVDMSPQVAVPSAQLQPSVASPAQPVNIPQQQATGNIPALIQKYFPKDQWATAYAVMMAESGGRPDAVGDNYPIKGKTIPSYGLFQIRSLPGRPDPKVLVNPEENVKYAAQMWKTQGWKPWSAYTNGKYRKFLK